MRLTRDLARLRILINRLETPKERFRIATVGSGPFHVDQFDDFLRSVGQRPYELGHGIDAVVVGEADYTTEEVHGFLDQVNGTKVRFFSQETYLGYLLTHLDPYELPERELRTLLGDHSIVELLDEVWVSWPRTHVSVSDYTAHSSTVFDLPSSGFLNSLGYRVGRQGLRPGLRRSILEEAWSSALPATFSPQYRSEWGEPTSARRLQKLANSLAAFCRNNRKKRDSSREAIQDWEADLDWLKRTYYKGRFRFEWPSAGKPLR